MDYKTFDPSDELTAFIKCFWTLEAPQEVEPEKQRIVPDGCMEMIFHYGNLFRQYNGSENFIQPRCFVFGQITSPLDIEPTGATSIFAVRFFPDGFTPFATMPLIKMENRPVALSELYGEEGVILEQEMMSLLSNEERIQILENFFLKKLVTPDAIDRLVKSSIETIIDLNGNLSVGELSDQLNINRRQLERKFHSVIGLSPKQLSKIVRLQSSLKMLANKDSVNLGEVALESNFYDQSHFIKDFKEFTGMNPGNFYANNLKMSSLFSSAE
ncbi:MAG: AraC family transcriptional regulator [Cyclobacteriaceae bacterium]|nr:AraC family transcriptional regulator [Cyclobacteriaceae bacterium]